LRQAREQTIQGAIDGRAKRLRFINARHEQTTAYVALGYACAAG